MTVEDTLRDLGHALPEPAQPLATYVPAVRTGNLVYCSGQIPVQGGTLAHRGQVGVAVDEDTAYNEAQVAVLNALAAIKSVIGDLDKISRIVRVTGYVNSPIGATNQPAVVNGASDLLGKAFGDCGRHSRSAIGVAALPLDACVEIEVIAEVRD